MPLKNEELKKHDLYFEDTARKNDLNKDEFIEKFNTVFDQLSKETVLGDLPRHVRIKRIKVLINSQLSKVDTEGSNFVFMLFGTHNFRDRNMDKFRYAKNLIEQNQISKLVKENKLLTIERQGKKIPVTSVEASHKEEKWYKDGKLYDKEIDDSKKINVLVVDEGTEWNKLSKETPLLRDDQLTAGWGGVNFSYSYELKHDYEASVVGLGYRPGTDDEENRLIEFKIYGDLANPNNDNYIFKNVNYFEFYKGKFVIDEDKTTDVKYVLKVPKNTEFTGVDIALDKNKSIDDYITIWINEIKEREMKKDYVKEYMEENNGELPNIIKMIPDVEAGLLGLDAFWKKHRKLTDEGKVAWSRTGKSYTEWGSYMLTTTTISEIRQGKYGPYVFLNDGGMQIANLQESVPPVHYPNNDSKLPGTYLLLITVSRENTRYDRETKDKVPDLENGDWRINIGGIIPVEDNLNDIEKLKDSIGDLF